MRAAVALVALALLGQGAAFTHSTGKGPSAPVQAHHLAATELPPAQEEAAPEEDASARSRLNLGLLGFALGLAAAVSPAVAKQPFQREGECNYGVWFGGPAGRGDCGRMKPGDPLQWKNQPDPGRLSERTADTGVAFKYGPNSKFGNGFNMGEQLMVKDGPETRFWARRPNKVAMEGGYFNYMNMTDQMTTDPKFQIRSSKVRYPDVDDISKEDLALMMQRSPVPVWGIKRKPQGS